MTDATGGWTPGPWVVNPICAQVDCGKISKLGGLLPVAQMLQPTGERPESETYANARLIAAAPDLYEALAAMYQRWDLYTGGLGGGGHTDDRLMTLARAALARARGNQ